jgi:hypothetical protein
MKPMKWNESIRKLLALGLLCCGLASPITAPEAQTTRRTSTYKRIKVYLDSIPAIDTHEHIRSLEQLSLNVDTAQGRGANLFSILKYSYYGKMNPLTPWKSGESFDEWWAQAKHDFFSARATSVYQHLLPSFQDLYGIDFDRITDGQARELDRRIFDHYRDQKWLYDVITERANIELMVGDRYWERLDFHPDYPFEFLAFDVTSLVWGFNPSEFEKGAHAGEIMGPLDDPFLFARKRGLPLNSLNDYLKLLDRMFSEAKESNAVCLKSELAYARTLQFENVPKERAAKAFGRPRSELTPHEIKDFEDFVMWRLAELSAKYDLPFQIHTGDALLEGSNPMLLVGLIDGNPKTKFILLHGGFPWVGETGAIVVRFPTRVWIDSVWLPTLSYNTAKRAFHEWLDVVPSNHIMWGGDGKSAEDVYGATEIMRRCWAEVLAEKVDRGDLSEETALQIGRQILRENALELFPQLKAGLWKGKRKMTPP